MNSIPNHLIVQSRCHAAAHSKGQLPFKGLLQQIEDLVSFGSARKVCDARCATIVLSISLSRRKTVVDDDSSLGVTLTDHIFINIHLHAALWLVASHMSKDGGTNRAFSPMFLADHHEQAMFMVFVRAPQHQNILIFILKALLVNLPNHKLLKADHAFFLLHLAARQGELDCMEIADLEDIVIFAANTAVLLVDHRDNKLGNLEQKILLIYRVLSIENHLFLVWTGLLHVVTYLLFA
jgi:hypothetical protein